MPLAQSCRPVRRSVCRSRPRPFHGQPRRALSSRRPHAGRAALRLAAMDLLPCSTSRAARDVWGASYTELFFLDEPTALAAGHRPCFECRRKTPRRSRRDGGRLRLPSPPQRSRNGPHYPCRAARRAPQAASRRAHRRSAGRHFRDADRTPQLPLRCAETSAAWTPAGYARQRRPVGIASMS